MPRTNTRGNAPEPAEEEPAPPRVGFAAATDFPNRPAVPGVKKPGGRLKAGYATARKLSPRQRAATQRRTQAEQGARSRSPVALGLAQAPRQELASHQLLQGSEPTFVPEGERPAPPPAEETTAAPEREIRPAAHLFARSDVPGTGGVGVQLFEGNRTPEPDVSLNTPAPTPTPSPNSLAGQRSVQFSGIPERPRVATQVESELGVLQPHEEIDPDNPITPPGPVVPRGMAPIRLSPTRAVEVTGREVVDAPAASGSEPAWPTGRGRPDVAAVRLAEARHHRIEQGGVVIAPEQFKAVDPPPARLLPSESPTRPAPRTFAEARQAQGLDVAPAAPYQMGQARAQIVMDKHADTLATHVVKALRPPSDLSRNELSVEEERLHQSVKSHITPVLAPHYEDPTNVGASPPEEALHQVAASLGHPKITAMGLAGAFHKPENKVDTSAEPLLLGEVPPGLPASHSAIPGEPEYVDPPEALYGPGKKDQEAWEASPKGAEILAKKNAHESRVAQANAAGVERPDQFAGLRSIVEAARHAQETGIPPDAAPELLDAPPHLQAMIDAAFYGAGSHGGADLDYFGRPKEMVFSSPEAEEAANTGVARVRPINGDLGMAVGERVANLTTATEQAHNAAPLSNLPARHQAAGRAVGIRAGTGNRRDVQRSRVRRALELHLDSLDHDRSVAFTDHLLSTGDSAAEDLMNHAANFFHPGTPGTEAHRLDPAKVYVARAFHLAHKLGAVNALGRPDPTRLDLSTHPDSHHSLLMASMAGGYGENKSYDQQQLEEKQAGQRKSRVQRIQRIYANKGGIPEPELDELSEDGTYLGLHGHEIDHVNKLLGRARAANALRGQNGGDIGVLKSHERKTLWSYMNRVHDALLADKPQTITAAAGGPSPNLGAPPPRATGKNPESVDLSDPGETMGEAFGIKDVGDTGIPAALGGAPFKPEGEEDTGEEGGIPEVEEQVAPELGTDEEFDTEPTGEPSQKPPHISDARWKKANELVTAEQPELMEEHGSDAHFAEVTKVAEAAMLESARKRSNTIIGAGTADFGETPEEQTIDRESSIPTKVVGQGGRLGRSQRDVLAGMQEIANQGAETIQYNAEQERVAAERQAAMTSSTDAREAAIQSLEDRIPRDRGNPLSRDLGPIKRAEKRVYDHFARHGDSDTKVARASLKRVTDAMHARRMETFGDQPGYTTDEGSPSAGAVKEVTDRIAAIKKDVMGESAGAAAW